MPSPSIESITIEPASQAPALQHRPVAGRDVSAQGCHARGAARSHCAGEEGRALHLTKFTGNWKRGAVITGNYTCNYRPVITGANYR